MRIFDGKAVVTTPSELEILIKRNFQAPPGVVFEAWTKAEHVMRWWDPSGIPLAVCEIDLRPGGTFRWINGGAAGFTFAGIYFEITAPARLVFAVKTLPTKREPITTLDFIEDQGDTRLEMRIVFESVEDRDALLGMQVEAGIVQTLANLGEYLRGSNAID